MPRAAVKAWVALTGHRRITAGDTVLTLGSGGVSVLALQLARVLGARVIATTSTADKGRAAQGAGASDVINHRLARRAEPTDRLKLPEFTDSPAEREDLPPMIKRKKRAMTPRDTLVEQCLQGKG